ncbi:hypothetical protein ABZ760_04430 [Streptomyces sp. NPDC006658]|uniref:hypothetical protein n=1 Tax=Streptomyces sp. NPDC006658 TaxID=3156900 RepID=UPI0033EBBE56
MSTVLLIDNPTQFRMDWLEAAGTRADNKLYRRTTSDRIGQRRSMPRLKKPPLPDGPHRDLNDALHSLHLRAGLPSLRDLADGIGDGVAGKSRIHDAFASDRLPTWGLLQLLAEVMVKTIPGSHLEAEESLLYQLWLKASGHSAASIVARDEAEQPSESPSASTQLDAHKGSRTRLAGAPEKDAYGTLARLKYAALSYTVDRIEFDHSECIRERGFYLSTGLETDPLAVHPKTSLAWPTAEAVTCRVSEPARRLNAAQHLGNLRADLLVLGMDFADGFKDVVDKVVRGESVHIVDHRR